MNENNILKVQSDYSPETYMKIVRTDDGDTIFKIYGNGEMRIATSGGQFHGKKLVAICDAVKALMEAISMDEDKLDKTTKWSNTSSCDGCLHLDGCGRKIFDTHGMSEEEIFQIHCVGCACGDGSECNRDLGCSNYEDGTGPLQG